MTKLLTNPSKMFDVEGKVALITGATGAFGQIAATTLGHAGCKLILAGGNQEILESFTAQLNNAGCDAVAICRRPDSEENCKAMVKLAIEQFEKLDILVVGSGMNDVDPIQDLSTERWQKVMDANVLGTWLICKAAGKQMIEQGWGGKVILVSSTRGRLGHPAGYTAYCPSKAATDGLARSLACEWGQHRINVNAIAPTVFRSDLTAWMFSNDDPGKSTREGMLSRIPLKRLGEPEDLAGPLLYLAAPASDFQTGQILYADGGYTAG